MYIKNTLVDGKYIVCIVCLEFLIGSSITPLFMKIRLNSGATEDMFPTIQQERQISGNSEEFELPRTPNILRSIFAETCFSRVCAFKTADKFTKIQRVSYLIIAFSFSRHFSNTWKSLSEQ